jgi:superfamily I DNA and RNA helicase
VPPGGAGTGLVQFYDDQAVWSEIGYKLESGSFEPGAPVTLVRIPEHTPEYFAKELQPADAVQCETFNSREEEAEWVAEAIARNLRDDGLQPSDILLVSANQYVKRGGMLPYLKALERQGIAAHVAGEDGSVDALFGDKGSVAVSGIRRAKGLEAAMVYVVSAEFGAYSDQPAGRRNALFSATTRSRAWVRLTGAGPLMVAIKAETEKVVQNDYKLSFSVPTKAERESIRTLQRDALAVQRVKRSRKKWR